jgi:hypothetical protein
MNAASLAAFRPQASSPFAPAPAAAQLFAGVRGGTPLLRECAAALALLAATAAPSVVLALGLLGSILR